MLVQVDTTLWSVHRWGSPCGWLHDLSQEEQALCGHLPEKQQKRSVEMDRGSPRFVLRLWLGEEPWSSSCLSSSFTHVHGRLVRHLRGEKGRRDYINSGVLKGTVTLYGSEDRRAEASIQSLLGSAFQGAGSINILLHALSFILFWGSARYLLLFRKTMNCPRLRHKTGHSYSAATLGAFLELQALALESFYASSCNYPF